MEELGSLRHLYVTVFLYSVAAFMALPAITDVTMAALCPGEDECSLAIYLSGFQQAIIGVGTVLMMPLVGNLSDVYGRKSMLTLPMTVSIVPPVILGYSRTTNFFYAYFALKTLTAMISDGSVQCLALAYVADNTLEKDRISAFGVLSGVTTAAIVCGTMATRLLSTASTFQVAAALSIMGLVYMRVFLKDKKIMNDGDDGLIKRPILTVESGNTELSSNNVDIKVFKTIPSPGDLFCMLRSSITFSQAAFVAFFSSLGQGGLEASLLYFFKARFHFNKNQFADIFLIFNIGGTISQLVLMPMVSPYIREEILLSIGLFLGFFTNAIDSIAWSPWVPYAVAVISNFVLFANPSLRSIISKQVGPTEQGLAQGCISGISSFANIIAPLAFCPLTALFLSEEAPFQFPGFSIMCIGLVWLMAFIASTMIKSVPVMTVRSI